MPEIFASAATALGSLFSHSMNWAACCGCLDWLGTAVAEPPHAPVAGLLGSHCGIGAIFPLPAVLAALPSSTPGAQMALSQPTWLPLLRAAFHSGVYIGLLSMSPLATRSPQYDATFWVGTSSIFTDQESPLVPHHDAPACWDSPVNQPASLAENVPRYFLGSAACTLWATSAYSAHVVGTFRPSLLSTSAR